MGEGHCQSAYRIRLGIHILRILVIGRLVLTGQQALPLRQTPTLEGRKRGFGKISVY